MNRQIFKCLTVVAIAVAATLTSCQKDDNDNVKVKLLETLTGPYGAYDRFEYDSQNRLSKYTRYNSGGELLETRTLTYSGNDLVKTEFNSALLHEYKRKYESSFRPIRKKRNHICHFECFGTRIEKSAKASTRIVRQI